MSGGEFALIERYFSTLTAARDDVLLGVGDDCALLRPPSGQALAVSIDTLVEGRHFSPGIDPAALGHKALAVGLSDLAAMGAEPAWCTLALTLPRVEHAWLAGFAEGLAALAGRYRVGLVGGDTTKGPRSVSIQVHGFVPPAQALRRAGARPGDLVYVTGTLGAAGLALLVRQGLFVAPEHLPELFGRLDRPEPRVAAGLAVRGLVSAAIDVSDGLAADLGHVCAASGVGATLYLDQLPCGPGVRAYIDETGDWHLPLGAGDDYELCLCVPPDRQGEFEAIAAGWRHRATWVGTVEQAPGVRVLGPDGAGVVVDAGGFDHFADEA
ncbi:MAG: thiamine-phosphate kinase [Gammaproteobacteria bacterium]